MSSLQSPNISLSESVAALQHDDWYALQARVRFEKSVCGHILGKGYEAYVPVTRERRRWSDRQQTIDLPLFPGYVFVRAALKANDKLAILQTSGAYSFVTFGGAIASIPNLQIEGLHRIEETNASWSPYPYLTAGRRVRIRGGSLDGLEGIFVAARGKKLVISIEPMQRSIAVDIGTYDVEIV